MSEHAHETDPTASEIIMVGRTDIQPYAANPRRITEQNVTDMAALIQHHGFRIPILVRAGDGVWELVDGHLRLRAAERLGLETLPAIDVSDMSDAQITAFRLSVNRAAELAEWDTDLLATELAMLRDTGDDTLSMSGFTDDDLSRFTAATEPAPTPDPAPADVGGQTINQSTDRRRVRNETDTVNLLVPMTVAQRTRAMARLDTIMQERGFNSRAEALLWQIELQPPTTAVEATKGRRRAKS